MNLTAITLLNVSREFHQSMNLVALLATLAVVMTSFALSSCRARQFQKAEVDSKEAKLQETIQLLTKRLDAVELTSNTTLSELKDLLLHLSTLHAARVVRNDTQKKYNDNRRNAELITANHRGQMNYIKAKDALSTYVISACPPIKV
jgi:hypothetical protein